MNTQIKAYLEQHAEPQYQAFTQKLVPNARHVLGVRMPLLHALAKEIAKDDWHSYLCVASSDTYEEIMLQGLVLTRLRQPLSQTWPYIEKWVLLVNNWAHCDSVAMNFSFAKKDKPLLWDLLQPYLKSNEEFLARFGVVVLLDNFINEEYIDRVLTVLETVEDNGYYTDMAVSWALSLCCAQFPLPTKAFLIKHILRRDVHNGAIIKVCQSRRVPDEQKAMWRTLLRK